MTDQNFPPQTDEELQSAIQDITVMVAEWLLVEGCGRRSAVRRLHESGGSKAEARGMVRLVHSILKAGLGRAYHRLPEKSRRIHFGQIDRLMAEHLSIHTTDTEV